MPTSKSAMKRVRTSEKARKRNMSVKSGISTSRRKSFETFKSNDREKSSQTFREYCSVLDKAAKKGVITKNTAIRRKKRAAAKLSAISSPKQS